MDKSFQLSRSTIENWNYLNMYSDKDYTLELLDYESNILDENEKDLVNEKHLTYFGLNDTLVTDYVFKKIDCNWFLVEKNVILLTDFKGKDFLLFVKKFSTDTVFMKNHIEYPLKYEYLDNAYSKKTKYITKEEKYKSDFFGKGYLLILNTGNFLPLKKFNIALRGTGNGWNSTSFFEERNGTWILVEDNDFST